MNNSQRQIKIASILSYIYMALQIVVSILTTPFIINQIGDSEYGVYKIMGSFVSYMTLLNFGFGSSAVRYLAEYRIKKEKKKEKEFLSFIYMANIIISVVIAIIGIFIMYCIPKIFSNSMTAEEQRLSVILFGILLFNIIMSVHADKYIAIINAYEKFIFIKLFDIIRTIFKIILIFSILSVSKSAITLTLIDFALNLMIMLLNSSYCRKRLKIKPEFNKRIWKNIDWKYYKEFLFYTSGIFINMIVNQLLWNVDSVVIGIRMSPADSAIYAVGTTFSSAFFNASLVITNMLLPKVVSMITEGAGKEELTIFSVKIARMQAYIIMYIYIAFLVFGKGFVYLWMGKGYEKAWTTAAYVMTATLFSSFFITVQVILKALKRQSFYNGVHLILFLCNAVCTYYAVGSWGIEGAAVMTLATYFFGYVFIMYPYYHRKIGINVWFVLKGLFINCIPCAVLIGLVSYVICRNIPVSWSMFIVEAVVYSAVYVIVMFFASMNRYEKGIILDFVRRMKK